MCPHEWWMAPCLFWPSFQHTAIERAPPRARSLFREVILHRMRLWIPNGKSEGESRPFADIVGTIVAWRTQNDQTRHLVRNWETDGKVMTCRIVLRTTRDGLFRVVIFTIDIFFFFICQDVFCTSERTPTTNFGSASNWTLPSSTIWLKKKPKLNIIKPNVET